MAVSPGRMRAGRLTGIGDEGGGRGGSRHGPPHTTPGSTQISVLVGNEALGRAELEEAAIADGFVRLRRDFACEATVLLARAVARLVFTEMLVRRGVEQELCAEMDLLRRFAARKLLPVKLDAVQVACGRGQCLVWLQQGLSRAELAARMRLERDECQAWSTTIGARGRWAAVLLEAVRSHFVAAAADPTTSCSGGGEDKHHSPPSPPWFVRSCGDAGVRADGRPMASPARTMVLRGRRVTPEDAQLMRGQWQWLLRTQRLSQLNAARQLELQNAKFQILCESEGAQRARLRWTEEEAREELVFALRGAPRNVRQLR